MFTTLASKLGAMRIQDMPGEITGNVLHAVSNIDWRV
jgi:hypothetical protein